jgi:hypothetical protein
MAIKKTAMPKTKASTKKGPGPDPTLVAMNNAERRKEFLKAAAKIGPPVGLVTAAILKKEKSEQYADKAARQSARATRKERRADVKTAKIPTVPGARGARLAKRAETLRTKAATLKEKAKSNTAISEKLRKSGY